MIYKKYDFKLFILLYVQLNFLINVKILLLKNFKVIITIIKLIIIIVLIIFITIITIITLTTTIVI